MQWAKDYIDNSRAAIAILQKQMNVAARYQLEGWRAIASDAQRQIQELNRLTIWVAKQTRQA